MGNTNTKFHYIDGAEYAFADCCACGTRHAFERHIYESMMQRCGRNGLCVYCPNGHSWYYVKGETEEDKLRLERDRLKQQLARKDDDIARQREMREAAERSAAAYKGQTTRLRKRAKHGVCPCCNRTFKDLARHMATKHADFDPDTDNVVELREIAK